MQSFSISTKAGKFIGSVSAKSKECLEARTHLGTDSDGKKFLFQYDTELHVASDLEQQFYNFLYYDDPPDENTWQIQPEVPIPITSTGPFYNGNIYDKITTPKTIQQPNTKDKMGQIYGTGSASIFGTSSSNESYLFKVGLGGSLILKNLNIFNFKDDPSFNIIDVSGGDLTISKCTFDTNQGVGSNIKVTGDSLDQQVSITDSSFIGLTTALIAGSAIHYNNPAGTLTISGSRFHDNHNSNQIYGGGAIYTNVPVIKFTGTNDFCGNHTSVPRVVAQYKVISMGGGAMYIDKPSTITIEDKTTFRTNSATYMDNLDLRATGGGAIYSNKSLSITGNGTVDFCNNDANRGGAIYSKGNLSLNISKSIFKNHTAKPDISSTSAGGAIMGEQHIIIHNAEFTSNSASFAGAIRISAAYDSNNPSPQPSSTLHIVDSFFSGNTTSMQTELKKGFGGAVSIDGNISEVVIKNTGFSGNDASYAGGAITCRTKSRTNTLTLDLTDSSFSENHTTEKESIGGALMITDTASSVTITGTNVLFENNGITTLNGGAIWSGAELTLSGDFSFNTNSASQYGGAIFSNKKLTLTPTVPKIPTEKSHMQFINNSAPDGLAIYSMDDIILGNTAVTRMTLDGAIVFINNTPNEGTTYTIWSEGNVQSYVHELRMSREKDNHIYAKNNLILMKDIVNGHLLTLITLNPQCTETASEGKYLCGLPYKCDGVVLGTEGVNECISEYYESPSRSNCEQLSERFRPADLATKPRPFVILSTDNMGPGCYLQSNGDWTTYYNTNSNASGNDGHYTPVCQKKKWDDWNCKPDATGLFTNNTCTKMKKTCLGFTCKGDCVPPPLPVQKSCKRDGIKGSTRCGWNSYDPNYDCMCNTNCNTQTPGTPYYCCEDYAKTCT